MGRFAAAGALAGLLVPLALGLGCAAAVAAGSPGCMDCHADPQLVRETDYQRGTSVFVDQALLDRSVHAGMDCVECHADASEGHPERLAVAACASCHGDVEEVVAGSLHGEALARNEVDAPTCGDCHGGHQILPAADSSSAVSPRRLPYTCARCHADLEFIRRRPVSLASPLQGYEQSVHFRALQAGKQGATCTDCHESHALYKPSDTRSTVYRANIAATCGKCHAETRQEYEQSIHGRALSFGNTDSPTCVDCHGEHEIRGPEDAASTVYPAHVSKMTCVWCHESERIVKKYGLPAQRLSTYADSYHGLADRGGSTVVANCASCHGVHDIRPSDDPRSSVAKANLPRTCGKCHPNAGTNFAIGMVHAAPGVHNGEHQTAHYVRRFYLLLIVGTVGAMVCHNGLDFLRNFRERRLAYGTDYLRFTVAERVQHGTMAVSFILLAYSGFALKFPDAWWAAPLAWMGPGEDGRRLLHRIAAVAMVAVCLFHIGYLALTRRGREQFKAMLPRLQDGRDAAQMVRYYLGRSVRPPAFARFSYIEKAEYWALVWGSVVMTVTGFALWFENASLQFVPKWGLDLATIVHYYEAWLAALAIVVWHFYWVIFSPRVYPMSLVWLNGRMSAEEMAHEHPLELEALRQEGAAGGEEPGASS